MNGVQTRLKCKPNVKRCKRFVFAAHSPLLHPNTLKTKAIIHFQTDHILTRFVFPPLQEAILQANAIAEKITREAEARAKATLAQAEAEARAIQLKLEAEAEGKKKSLLAEAEGFEAMVRAAESNPAIAIQYKMVDQWKEIAGEQVKAFEHMNLGNITVFDGGNGSTSNFLNTLVKTVAPSLGVLDKLPIGETVKGIIHPENKTEEKTEEKKEEKKK